ncbi:hypothetical protein [Sporosarcina sp. FSL K6-3457]|uniref:hypothetical protein n=1 Tax=Sporosarcina sp. FSL K6-3457 TaxID=2978204 RepID=UPI0030F50E38
MFVSALNNERSFSMQVRDAGSTSDDAWRKVWGKEAAAINPLAAVNHGRNNLILESIRTNDWSDYHNFQAKQHPAWYDKINGEFKQNKMYYGNLIDGQHRSLKEAIQSGDQTEIVKRQGRLDELIADFKKAPGEVPHITAFITDPALAAKHGIGKPANAWYNSPYNNAIAASQGKFEEQYWYDNPYFADHPKELTFAMEAVQELRPAIAKLAAEINKGAYERNIASTSYTARAVQSIAATVIEETVKEAEKDMAYTPKESVVAAAQQAIEAAVSDAIAQQANQIVQQFSTATLVEQLFKQREQLGATAAHSLLFDQLDQNAEKRTNQKV